MRDVSEGKGLKCVKVLEGSEEEMRGVEKGWAYAIIVARVGLRSQVSRDIRHASSGKNGGGEE